MVVIWDFIYYYIEKLKIMAKERVTALHLIYNYLKNNSKISYTSELADIMGVSSSSYARIKAGQVAFQKKHYDRIKNHEPFGQAFRNYLARHIEGKADEDGLITIGKGKEKSQPVTIETELAFAERNSMLLKSLIAVQKLAYEGKDMAKGRNASHGEFNQQFAKILKVVESLID